MKLENDDKIGIQNPQINPIEADANYYGFPVDTSVWIDREACLAIIRRADRVLRWEDLPDVVSDLLERLQYPTPVEVINTWRSEAGTAGAMSRLFDDGFVQPCRARPIRAEVELLPEFERHVDQIIYYSSFCVNPIQPVHKLRTATAVVVGLGGLGSETIRHLSAAGIGRLVCIDHDSIELSNLNRQHCYAPTDVGRLKTDALRDYLQRHAPEVTVHSATRFVDGLTVLTQAIEEAFETEPPSYDIVICCADEPVGLVEIACIQAARRAGCAMALAAMHLRRGYWGVLTGASALDRAEIFFQTAANFKAARPGPRVTGSASWENSVIGANLAGDSIAYLANLSGRIRADRLIRFDFTKMAAEILVDFSDAEGTHYNCAM
jgi:hypothetical protein